MKSLIAALLLAVTLSTAGGMKSLKAGDTAPAFTLKNHDGKDVSLDTLLKGNTYAVVMFVATRCPVSNAYNGRMAALAAAFGGREVAFVGINSNKSEPVEEIGEHAKEHKFGFPVVKDPNNVIADAYGAAVTPEIFVVDKKLTILYHGRIDDSRNKDEVKKKDLEETLAALLAGKEAPKEQPRAFGCSIKRVEDAAP